MEEIATWFTNTINAWGFLLWVFLCVFFFFIKLLVQTAGLANQCISSFPNVSYILSYFCPAAS